MRWAGSIGNVVAEFLAGRQAPYGGRAASVGTMRPVLRSPIRP